MAVAETASSITHRSSTSAPSPTCIDPLTTALRFSLLTVTLAIVFTTLAHAQILGDRNAPRNQQPTVLAAPNGVPVVNIQTPNRAGVSLNSYRQFDVGSNGVILNNAASTTNTQLGGYVAGNPWLATGVARTIVNQVNSPNPSYLRGYVEVAGNRAQVVIANPYGISCAGCGFINASRITLTTGATQIVNGNLDSYRVAGGSVRIEGAGMDARQTEYAEIIARAVQVNAGIWANDLKVSTGLNTVSADHRSVLPGVAPSEPAPVVAIDVAQLGGMYAGHIILTATEHGVGVRNAGSIGASVGQAVVTVDGRLENSGSLTTNGLLAVQSTGGISNRGELGSKSAVSLTTSRLDNAGNINSAGNLAVQASDSVLNTGNIGGNAGVQISAASIDNRKSLGSGATLDLQAATTLSNSGTLQANGNTTLTAATLNNSGTISATQATLTINSSADSLNSGRIEAAQKLTLNTAKLSNSGTFSAVQDIRITSSRQKILDQKLYNGGLTAQEIDEYYSNGHQIQMMQAALQEANRQFRYVVPMSQWTSQERESAFSDSMMALGGVGAAVAVAAVKSTPNTKIELAVESSEKSANSATKVSGGASSPMYPAGIGFEADIPSHLSTIDGFSQKTGVGGAHNANTFSQAVKDYNLKIINETPTSTPGVTNVGYQVPALDRSGNLLLDANGNPVYKAQSFRKTVYDPSVISDAAILKLGQQAAASGYADAIANGARAYNSTAGGITFRIYIDPKTGLVTNFHPQ